MIYHFNMAKLDITYTVNEKGKIPEPQATMMRDFHIKMIGKQLNTKSTNERPRSTVQNSWFHKINQLISDFRRAQAKDEGDEFYYKINAETNKIWIKENFLGYVEINGERHLRKTSTLKTFEMNELWENLQIHFAPLGLVIPDPDQKDFLDNNVNNM